MIRALGLSWKGGAEFAIAGFDATIAAGEVVAIDGAQPRAWALVRLLATLLRPSTGRLTIDDVDAIERPLDARRRLAYASPDVPLPEGLTTGEYLAFVARARQQPLDRVSGALQRFGLDPRRIAAHLRASERQRVRLAAAAATGSRIVLLDRPFECLDVAGRGTALEWLRQMRDEGVAVVLSGAPADLAELPIRTLGVVEAGA